MSKLVIGLDFGSDSVRALLVDLASGEELGSEVFYYPRWRAGKFCDAHRQQFRQHPLDYIEGMESVISGVLKKCCKSDVVAIGVDTTGSTPCAVDRAGVPLALKDEFADNPNAMFVLWKDHTAIPEAMEINDYAKSWGGVDFTMYEGGIYSSEWFWSKLLHVWREDARVREAAFSFVEHCDWICAFLTGNTDPLTLKRSRCAAGHKALWHPSWGGLPPEEFLVGLDPLLAGMRECLYTETYTADVPAGVISREYAAKFGLREDVVISGSAFDAHIGAVGVGVCPGKLVKVFGTSTCDMLVVPEIDHCVRGICGQVDGSIVPGLVGLEAGQAAFGDIYAWFQRLLSYGGNTVSLSELEKDAMAVAPGTSGVLSLDWMNGRRTPDANLLLQGVIGGLNLGSTPAMVYRSLVESTLFGSRRIAERFQQEGVVIDSIIAIGGISKKSDFVMQTCADVLNRPIDVAGSEQACALGAAIFGAVAAGFYPDCITAASRMGSGTVKTYRPDPVNVAIYDRLYREYVSLGEVIEKWTMSGKEAK